MGFSKKQWSVISRLRVFIKKTMELTKIGAEGERWVTVAAKSILRGLSTDEVIIQHYLSIDVSDFLWGAANDEHFRETC